MAEQAETPENQPTTPLPETTASAPVVAATVPAAEPARAKTPWPVLVPVIVGVGALLVGVVAGGAIGYVAGHRTGDRGPSIELRMPDGMPGAPDRAPFGGFGDAPRSGFDGSVAHGTVSSVDDDSITIELPNGDTVTYRLTDDTDVVEVTESNPGDLAEGDDVTVIGRGRGAGGEARLIRMGDALAATPEG